MRNLWLSSVLLLVLIGCSKKNVPVSSSSPCEVGSTWRLIAATNSSIKYKADVTLYGKYFSGLLILKANKDSTCRVVFASIAGAKFFEILLMPDKDSVVYAMPQLSNPKVITAVANDLRTLTSLHKFEGKPLCIKLSEETFPHILQYVKDKDVYRYFYGQDFTKLHQIEVLNQSLKQKIKFVINYKDESLIAERVEIRHLNVKLKIILTNF